MSSSTPTPTPFPTLRLAQATIILLLTTSGALQASLSLFLVPRLLESPTPLLIRQFASAQRASRLPLAVARLLPGLVSAYLACRLPGRRGVLYAVAAALSLSTAPWSWAFVGPVERRLEGRTGALLDGRGAGADADVGVDVLLVDEILVGSGGGGETAHALVDRWAVLNLYRPAAALLAGCVGLYAALS